MREGRHLLLYDGGCPFCNRIVAFVIKRDKRGLFLFAPLEGESAEPYLERFPKSHFDTVILVENYKTAEERVYIEAKAAFRVLWHVGGLYRLVVLFSLFPSLPLKLLYRWVARHRYKLFPKPGKIDVEELKSRLLP